MRTAAVLSLTLLGLASTMSVESSHGHHHNNYKSVVSKREVKKGHFGALEISEFPEENEQNIKVVKEVHLPKRDFVRDYERQSRALKQAQI